MLILLSQNEQGISALDLQKHIFPSGSSSMKSTYHLYVYIYTEKPVNDQSYGVLDRYGITILYK
jgi:hypothetical protein